MGGLIRQGPCHGVGCEIRNWMVHMGRFAENSGALTMSYFRARWSIWRYWGKCAPLKRTPWCSSSPRTPHVGYVSGGRTPHEFFRISCWTEYRAPSRKLENWSSLDFLLEKRCVLHKIQYNDSRIPCFPVSACLSCCSFSSKLSVYYYYICDSVHTPCIYLMYDYIYVYVWVRYSLLDGSEWWDPVSCIAHTMSTRSISPVGIQYRCILRVQPRLLAYMYMYNCDFFVCFRTYLFVRAL